MKRSGNIKSRSVSLMLIVILVLLSGCGSQKEEPSSTASDDTVTVGFMHKYASVMNDDTGWQYIFEYEYNKQNSTQGVYIFIGMNLRYRYDDAYWGVCWNERIDSNGNRYWAKVMNKPGVLLFGNGSEAELRDRKILNTLLGASRTPDEILKENPDDYVFETLDRDLVFRLIREALMGDPLPDSGPMDYWMKPANSMKVEPAYQDGYKFQIGFSMKNFLVDEIYIDVLYQTGEEYNAYEQLSDLVDQKKASADQEEAFALIQKIRTAIKEESSFAALADTYKTQVVGNIDFSRLYTFLLGIHTNTLDSNYTNTSENVPFKEETFSEEEYYALEFK